MLTLAGMAKKLALCVGINDYPGTGNDLAGCVNDARDWADYLTSRGYAFHDIVDSAATHDAQVDRLKDLLDQAGYGDTVIYTNSSHGTWVPDASGDEADGRDEAIVCYDFSAGGLLVDDELYEISQARKRGVHFFIVSDSCHSGSVSRFVDLTPDARANAIRYMPLAATGVDPATLEVARVVEALPTNDKRSRTGAVLLSGCKDDEYSYDTEFAGRPNGAFTRVALDTLIRLGKDAMPTVAQWYAAIRKVLPTADYPQTPQLTATYAQKRWLAP